MQETGLVLATDKYSRLSCKRQQKSTKVERNFGAFGWLEIF